MTGERRRPRVGRRRSARGAAAGRTTPAAAGRAPKRLAALPTSSQDPSPPPQPLLPTHSPAPQADAPSDPARLKQHLKDTFGAFNAALERVYAGQSSWTVPDAALRDAMRRVVKNDVIQPYRDFMRK